jgi:CO/xanthine dehydrogenase FAD-binding subunit
VFASCTRSSGEEPGCASAAWSPTARRPASRRSPAGSRWWRPPPAQWARSTSATLHTARPGGATAGHRIDEFFEGLFQTRLEDDELLAGIDLPEQPAGATFGYRRFSYRRGEYPMAVAACRLGWEAGRCTGARVAVGGGGPSPSRLPELERVLEGVAAADVVAAATTEAPYQQLRPLADIRGGEDWKRRVITKLVRDTVADAVQARS